MKLVRELWRRTPESARSAVRRAVPRSLQSELFSVVPQGNSADLSPQKREGRPLLSIVLPVYNVEEYVEQCLRSIAAQTFRDFEVVVVNDGSADGTAGIVERFIEKDRRFTLVHQENRGLGAARNAGIAHAKGVYLTFCDSDDYLINGGYGPIVERLERTGSDFGVGAIDRIQGGKQWTPQWVKDTHRTDAERATLAEHPEILADVTAWNKVFRRSFFDEHLVGFPEGILYEDQELTAKAFIQASAFDIHKRSMYVWRVRESGLSITQRKAEVGNLADRLLVARAVEDVMASAPVHVQGSWWAKTLGPDLGLFVNEVPRAGDDFWSVLRDGIRSMVGSAASDVFHDLRCSDRLLVHTILRDDRDEVVRLLTHFDARGRRLAVREAGDGAVLEVPGGCPCGSSCETLVCRDVDVEVVSRIVDWLDVDGDRCLLTGYAIPRGFVGPWVEASVEALLVDPAGETVSALRCERIVSGEADRIDGDWFGSYEGWGVQVEFRQSELCRLPAGTYSVVLEIEVAGFRRRVPFQRRSLDTSAGRIPLMPAVDGVRSVFMFSEARGLTVDIDSPRVAVESIEVDGDRYTIGLGSVGHVAPVRLAIEAGKSARQVDVTRSEDRLVATFRLPSPPVERSPGVRHDWKIRVVGADGRRHHLNWLGSERDFFERVPQDRPTRIDLTAYGYLRVRAQRWFVEIDSAALSEDLRHLDVSVSSKWLGENNTRTTVPRLVLASPATEIDGELVSLDPASGRSAWRFALSDGRWGDGPGTGHVPMGTYTVRIKDAGASDVGGAYWPSVGRAQLADLPSESVAGLVRARLAWTPKDRALALSLSPGFAGDERGAGRQHALERAARSGASGPDLVHAALFEVFGGLGAGDSPAAIARHLGREQPDLPLYWTVKDSHVVAPSGTIPVLRHSRRWYELLSSSRLLVNNNNFPHFFEKSPGQTYLQTWHGTPLKRIGRHVPAANLSLSYRALMERESASWDLLVAQSPLIGPILSEALDYGGTMFDQGYPRNDSLLTDGALDDQVRVLRDRLGIGPGQKVLLYAPTWRDNLVAAGGSYNMVNFLDVDMVRARFGDEWTILYRGHSNTLAGGGRLAGRVHDVSRYPDINVLMKASDALVTDYSSIMFDYAVLDRPQFFLVPDLMEYEERTRGFYFDYLRTVPGEAVGSTGELVDLMADFDAYSVSTRVIRSTFRARFAPHDDGHSAERMVAALGAFL